MARARISIIGLGQIGGSIGLSLKKAGLDVELIGHDKDHSAAREAQKRGAVDKTEWNLLNACDGAGLIVLALPLNGVRETLEVLSRELPEGTIVTDTAFTMAPVLKWAEALPPGVSFVGGDPIIPPAAATNPEARGIQAASAELFENAVYCLTPAATASESAINTVAGFVALLGAKPLFVDAHEHDGLITGAEHMAYVLSAALLQATTTSGGWRDLSRLAGADYLHATELATRDPVGQREMMLHHREDIARWIDATVETLRELRGAVTRGDAEHLDRLLKRMLDARAEWLAGEVGAGPAPDYTQFQRSAMQMFMGGLAPRLERKKR